MGRRGVTVRLKHVQAFKDRFGRWRYYFRKPGMPRVTLPDDPRSSEFLTAYNAALANTPVQEPTAVKAATEGTIARLVDDYFNSPNFLRNKRSSQKVTRGILTKFSAAHGHRLVADMEFSNVAAIMGRMSETPAAANNLLKKLRVLMKFAIAKGLRTTDPTFGIERYREGKYHTWTDEELAQFESRWPLGTRQRTTYALALYTGQRRSDLATMDWGDFDRRANTIRVVQEKTGAELHITVHKALREALEKWPRRQLTILAIDHRKGRSAAGLGNSMAEAIDKAGLPKRCVLHGLRKAAARRLAEVGCTTHEIMAITGHKSVAEVQRYTEQANQKRRAGAAIRKLELSNRPGKFYKKDE